MKNKDAKKPNYSMWSDISFLLGKAWELIPWYYPLMVVIVVSRALIPAITMVLPSRVIALLQEGVSFERLVLEIGLMSLGILLCAAISEGLRNYVDFRYLITPRIHLGGDADLKIATTDYPHGEQQDFQNAMTRRLQAMNSNDSALEETFRMVQRLLSNLIGLGVYGALLWTLSPWVMLLVAALTALGFIARLKANTWVFKSRDKWAPIDRKMNYIEEESGNYKFAKDVRLFGMSGWLCELYDSCSNARRAWGIKQGWVEFAADAASCLITFLREGAAYIWLIYGAVTGSIDPAAFVLYFGAVGNFSQELLGCLKEFSDLHEAHLKIASFRELLDWPDQFRHEGGRPIPRDEGWTLTLDHVSYRYPGADKDTIHDMCLTLRSGEKAALVGLNGAGKSTMVKLLCGLYDPTEGRVLLNGIPVTEFNREEYYALFSAVFQESAVRPYPLAKNVAMTDNMDRKKVEKCLELAGLSERVSELPKGMDTKLMKYIWHDGVDLSGGEAQKLMLARALYKDGPIVILDEPTAALDPIAESELYEKYSDLTAGKTSLYISHRLSSTRFCDRVLFLEHGVIAEEGTHEELLEKRGKYYELYEVQSSYYRSGSTDEEGELINEAEMEPV